MPEVTPQAEIHAEIKPQPTPELASLRSPENPIEITILMTQIARASVHEIGHLDLALDTFLIQRYPEMLWLWRASPHSTAIARIGTDDAKHLWTHGPEDRRLFLVNFHAGIHEVVGLELAQSILWPDIAWAVLRGEWAAAQGWVTKEDDHA